MVACWQVKHSQAKQNSTFSHTIQTVQLAIIIAIQHGTSVFQITHSTTTLHTLFNVIFDSTEVTTNYIYTILNTKFAHVATQMSSICHHDLECIIQNIFWLDNTWLFFYSFIEHYFSVYFLLVLPFLQLYLLYYPMSHQIWNLKNY